MNLKRRLNAAWRADGLLRRVVKNSSYLFGSNTLSAVLAFVQGIIAVQMVGVAHWGLIAVIMAFSVNVNRLLTFRMSEVVVKRLGQSLADDRKEHGAAAVKAAGLVEMAMSVLAFVIVLLLSGFAATVFAKDPAVTPWFSLYASILLGSALYETSTGVLQAVRRFDRLARIHLVQSVITASVISGAYLLQVGNPGMQETMLIEYILLAYILGKIYAGVSVAIAAICELNDALGKGWWRVPLNVLPDKAGMFKFSLNTNLNGTVNLFTRDNIPLYMGALLSTTEVGYLKLALSLLNPILLILDPFIWPTYVEITNSIAARQWDATLRLLRRVSLIAAGVVGVFGGGLAAIGWWLIPALYGAEAAPAYPALLVLLLGYGFSSVFQWNRPLMLSLGKPGYPVLVAALVGIVELALIFTLSPRYGYLMLAGLLSLYLIVTISIIVWRGVREIQLQQKNIGAAA